MEENLKNAISAMRMKIAEMEKEQRNNKNQRKTVRIVGEKLCGSNSKFKVWQLKPSFVRMFFFIYAA